MMTCGWKYCVVSIVMRMLKNACSNGCSLVVRGAAMVVLGVLFHEVPSLAQQPNVQQPNVQRPVAEQAIDQDRFARHVAPMLERFCIECHNEDDASGGVDLTPFYSQVTALQGQRVWLKVLDAVESGAMPPDGSLRPTHAELNQLIQWVEGDFFRELHAQNPDPQAVVVRRLNRQEYDNTIRDLTGLDLQLAGDFPADDIGFGYDNIGSALNLSPIHIEKYLNAAEAVSRAAIPLPDAVGHAPTELIGLRTYPLKADQPVEFEHHLQPGRYLVDFSLVRVGIDDSVEAPWLIIGLGSDRRKVTATRIQDETLVYRLWLHVASGDDTARVVLAKESAQQLALAGSATSTGNVSGDKRYGNNLGLHVDSMVVRGPVAMDRASPTMALRTAQSPKIDCESPAGLDSRRQCAEALLLDFATRAFRRPLQETEFIRLMDVFGLADSRGESFERSVQVAVTAVLVSPQFLFLVEPEGESTARVNRPLDDYELASRLSYFLWSTTPDDELIIDARNGRLRHTLRHQVERMLQHEKADAFVENFVGQWLQLRNLDSVSPDPGLYSEFDDGLRQLMRKETQEFFAYILRQNRNVLEILDADYAFLNDRLARHYGIESVRGPEMRMVKLANSDRGGVLTQASVLTITSNPNRTSPVKRGQWVLQQILGSPPPPPPPGVVELDESPEANDAASLRERMELHRANPECAACHQQMDAIGFALEMYDPIGKLRSDDHGFPIDTSGQLNGGVSFADAAELKGVLTTETRKKFTRCLIENMLTYALGRSIEPNDFLEVEGIRRDLDRNDFRMQELVMGIVESDAFLTRGVSN